jgi:hypothetical protein
MICRVRLLPFERVVLHVPRPPAEVREALVRFVAPDLFYFFRPEEPLMGEVAGNRYRVWLATAIFSWRRDKAAIAEGAIEADGTGSVLRLRLRPSGIVAVIATIWIVVGVAVAIGAATAVPPSVEFAALGSGGVVLGAALLHVPFALDARKLKRILRERLGATEGGPNRLV